tara:strand:- start:293 stop:451 length:159 start_codon:yes stop_codon:yes gene_type:complete
MKEVPRVCALCNCETENSVCSDCEEEAFNIVNQLLEEEYLRDLWYDKMRDNL